MKFRVYPDQHPEAAREFDLHRAHVPQAYVEAVGCRERMRLIVEPLDEEAVTRFGWYQEGDRRFMVYDISPRMLWDVDKPRGFGTEA